MFFFCFFTGFFFSLFGRLEAQQQPEIQVGSVSANDPYVWLEDAQSEKTKQWLEKQLALFEEYIQKIDQNDLKTQLAGHCCHTHYSIPMEVNGVYFFTQKQEDQEQGCLWLQEGKGGPAKILFDPNKQMVSSGRVFALEKISPSACGKFVALGLIENGSDWTTWYVLDVAAGELLSDKIEKTKFVDVCWDKASNGFYYSRQETDSLQKVYYHALGEPQESDLLVQDAQSHVITRHF
jgi:prolyl oligopeptidase